MTLWVVIKLAEHELGPRDVRSSLLAGTDAKMTFLRQAYANATQDFDVA